MPSPSKDPGRWLESRTWWRAALVTAVLTLAGVSGALLADPDGIVATYVLAVGAFVAVLCCALAWSIWSGIS